MFFILLARRAFNGNGNVEHRSIGRIVNKVNCLGIYEKTIKIANKRFVPLCPDLSGNLGELVLNDANPGSSAAFPIDLIVADYAAIVDEDDTEDTEDTIVEVGTED